MRKQRTIRRPVLLVLPSAKLGVLARTHYRLRTSLLKHPPMGSNTEPRYSVY